MNKTKKVEVTESVDIFKNSFKIRLAVFILILISSILIIIFQFNLPDMLITKKYIGLILIISIGIIGAIIFHANIIYELHILRKAKNESIQKYNIYLKKFNESEFSKSGSIIMAYLLCILTALSGGFIGILSNDYDDRIIIKSEFVNNSVEIKKCYDINNVISGAAYKGYVCIEGKYNKGNNSFSELILNTIKVDLKSNHLLFNEPVSKKNQNENSYDYFINVIKSNKDKIKDHEIVFRNDEAGVLKLTFENLVILSERQAF